MIHHVFILHIKMELLKEKIDIFLRLVELFFFNIIAIYYCILDQSFTLITKNPFDYIVFVHDYGPQRGNLDPHVIKCMFIGYYLNQMEYKCYDSTTKRTYISFVESLPFYPLNERISTSFEFTLEISLLISYIRHVTFINP
ncbi:hypothetical protein V2J09_021083 [Rumex salicifolius]